MIRLTRINHVPLVLNSDLIEHVEVTPDTVITLTNGQKVVVLESPDVVIERVVAFRRAASSCLFKPPIENATEQATAKQEPPSPEPDQDSKP